MGGQFAGLTYLATYLSEITGVSGAMTTIFLLCFGVANAVGTMFGGREADRDAAGTLLRANLILVAALAVLSVTDATRSSRPSPSRPGAWSVSALCRRCSTASSRSPVPEPSWQPLCRPRR